MFSEFKRAINVRREKPISVLESIASVKEKTKIVPRQQNFPSIFSLLNQNEHYKRFNTFYTGNDHKSGQVLERAVRVLALSESSSAPSWSKQLVLSAAAPFAFFSGC